MIATWFSAAMQRNAMDPAILVLLVEDEPLIQDIIEAALEDGGYAVSKVGAGAEAISILDRQHAEFSVLVSDVNLGPGQLTGWDVAKHARELDPDMPVVYITGDSGHAWAVNGVPNSLLLNKPFDNTQLVTAVSRLLNALHP
jgi:DNA-binding NtrC family response regulator